MAKKKKNSTISLIVSLCAALLLSVFVAIPLMLVGYTWILYALKEIPVWVAIVATALVSVAESLLIISELGD